ncbi:MAG: hypothetical protein ACYC9Q_05970 [Bacillota bacterium]
MRRFKWLMVLVLVASFILLPAQVFAGVPGASTDGICKGPGILAVTPDGICKGPGILNVAP